MRLSERESGVWSRQVGFKATVVGKANLKPISKSKLSFEVEGNLNGEIER